LGVTRGGLIELDTFFDETIAVIDEDTNEELNIIKIDGVLYAQVDEIKPLSYKLLKLEQGSSLSIKKADCNASESVDSIFLQNKYISLKVDKNKGNIISLKNNITGKEWVDTEKEFGFGQYLYSIYSKKEIIN
jgi:hypothetical protein